MAAVDIGIASFHPKDEAYDFALGPKDYLFYLGSSTAISVQVGNFFSPITVKSDQTNQPSGVTDDEMKFQVKWYVDGVFKHGIDVSSAQGNVFENQTDFFGVVTPVEITRKKYKDVSAGNVWVGIHGQNFTYPASFNQPGNHIIEYEFYHLPTQAGGFSNSGFQNTFMFRLFQKAVPVTKDGIGTVLSNGSTISSVKSIDVLTFDKTANRGDEVSSTWTIQVSTGSGYISAIQGVDYDLVSGTLTSDVIQIRFPGAATNGGTYRVINSASGYTSANHPPFSNTFSPVYQSGITLSLVDPDGTNDVTSNSDTVTTNIQVDSDNRSDIVTEVISLPIVTPIFTPLIAFDNTTVSIDPLTGITDYIFTVSPNVDISNTSWSKTTISYDPITQITTTTSETPADGFTINDWIAELQNRAKIFCEVYLGGIAIISKVGLGPHTFKLGVGEYKVGYRITEL